MEDKEELGMSCWEYLGEIRYIFLKKLGFLFQKNVCLKRSSFIFSVLNFIVSESIVKKKKKKVMQRLKK